MDGEKHVTPERMAAYIRAQQAAWFADLMKRMLWRGPTKPATSIDALFLGRLKPAETALAFIGEPRQTQKRRA